MPSEVRHVLFQPPEVVQAVKAYHRRLGTPLPAGAIQRCGPEAEGTDGAVRFRITIVPDSAERTHPTPVEKTLREITIEGSALAAALILHCSDLRIPLPASAAKSLRCFGEQVCLVVAVNARQSPSP